MKQEKSRFWTNCNLQLGKATPGIQVWHLLSLEPPCSLLCRCSTGTPWCQCKHTHSHRPSQRFVGRAKLPLKFISQVQRLCQALSVSSIPPQLLQSSWMSHANLNVLGLSQATPGENLVCFILLWCYCLSYSPGLWSWQQSHFTHMNNLSKSNEAPHISISNCFGCKRALPISPGGNRAVIMLEAHLGKGCGFLAMGHRTTRQKSKNLKGWNHSATALLKAELYSLALTHSKQKGISATSLWGQIWPGSQSSTLNTSTAPITHQHCKTHLGFLCAQKNHSNSSVCKCSSCQIKVF